MQILDKSEDKNSAFIKSNELGHLLLYLSFNSRDKLHLLEKLKKNEALTAKDLELDFDILNQITSKDYVQEILRKIEENTKPVVTTTQEIKETKPEPKIQTKKQPEPTVNLEELFF